MPSDTPPQSWLPAIKSITLLDRIVSPMCQRSSKKGVAKDPQMFHREAHGGEFRYGGGRGTSGLPGGTYPPKSAALWADKHMGALGRIVRFVRGQGTLPAVRLVHAVRKGAGAPPSWDRATHLPSEASGWTTIAQSARVFSAGLPKVVREITAEHIARLHGNFVAAAKRVLTAACELLKLHSAG